MHPYTYPRRRLPSQSQLQELPDLGLLSIASEPGNGGDGSLHVGQCGLASFSGPQARVLLLLEVLLHVGPRGHAGVICGGEGFDICFKHRSCALLLLCLQAALGLKMHVTVQEGQRD
jgi:hypothetical protein